MLFNSYSFILFFPIVVAIYWIIPKKWQQIWILICSYYFYMSWDARYVVLLLFSTVVTYLSGILLERIWLKADETQNTRKEKAIVVISVLLNLSVLFWFKYLNFFLHIVNGILGRFHIVLPVTSVEIVLPVGISFFTFQALSYTIDVYRRETTVEKNFFRYALFVSFFPQLVAGPIERSKNLLKQVNEKHTFDYEKMREGFLLMLWGFFMKLVIADRAGIFVDTVFQDLEQFGGFYVWIAVMLFAIQIYCDFGGYSTIAIGAAKVMGFSLMENFNCPYYAISIGDFWRRWHISLSSWFRDYLYIPLGGNRKGKVRKYMNLLIVMAVSGLWHGPDFTFIIWGFLHGVYQVLGNILKPVRQKVNQLFHLQIDSLGHKLFNMAFTFGLVDFAWLFFRADNMSQAMYCMKEIISARNIDIFFNKGLFSAGLNEKNFQLLLLAIVILAVADLFKYKGIVVRNVIVKQELWFRWLCYLSMLAAVLIFGIWGSAYNAASFIYFQF